MPRPPHKLSATAERRIRRAATVFVVFVAVAAAVLSFSGLHRLATDAGFHPDLAWLFPIATDVAVAAFSLAVVHHTLAGMRAVYPWVCMLLGVGVSVAGNVWAAPDDMVSRLVHAWPPVVFALAFEALARLLRHRIEADGRDEPRCHEQAAPQDQAPPVAPLDPPRSPEAVTSPASAHADPAPVSGPAPALARGPQEEAGAVSHEGAGDDKAGSRAQRPEVGVLPAPDGAAAVNVAHAVAGASPRAGTLAERVAEVLRTHRGEGMSHAQIARLVGADRSNVSKTIRKLRTTHPELFEHEGEG